MKTEPIYAEQSLAGDRFGDSVNGPGVRGLGSIEFRVLRSGTPARRMRLNSTRCTLGNGEGCTVRLHDPSLRPMHAVILRDAHRVLLRAYTVPIEVNGHLTGESFLHVGDTFTLGSYHFELIEGSGFDTAIAHTSEPSTHVTVPSGHHSSTEVAGPTDSRVASSRVSEMVRRRPRLSFQGGGVYVSEAMQAFVAGSTASLPLAVSPRIANESVHEMDLAVTASRDTSDGVIDQLRRDLEVWRQREQDWKEQQARTNDELALAVSRFHQSQERANEASDAVSELRGRIDQLTRELDALVVDSREYRAREAKLLAEVDSAFQAREQAILERDEAIGKVNAAHKLRQDAERKTEEAKHLREIALGEVDIVVRDRDRALTELGEADNARKSESEKVAQVAKSLTLANEQLQSLTQELSTATHQLAICKRELADSYARVDEATRRAETYQEQLATSEATNARSSEQYQENLDQLQTELRRLEAECAETRKHAESAAADRQLVESLRTKLEKLESTRNVDRLSWECEATQLQQSVQQLSLELAAVNGQLSKAESDNVSLRSLNDTLRAEQDALKSQQDSLQSEFEATQTELNSTYERLTVARKELSLRPSTEQWDEVQTKLAHAEQQLAESEKLLASLRADYDELMERQTNLSSTSEKIETPAPAWVASLPQATEDQGWPTYDFSAQETNDSIVKHPTTVAQSDPPAEETAEPLLSNEYQVADRLQSYMSHEVTRYGQHHEHEVAEHQAPNRQTREQNVPEYKSPEYSAAEQKKLASASEELQHDAPVVSATSQSRSFDTSSSWVTYRREHESDHVSIDEAACGDAPNDDVNKDGIHQRDASSTRGSDWAVQWSMADESEQLAPKTPSKPISQTDDSEELHEGDFARRLIAQLSGSDSSPEPMRSSDDAVKRPIVLDNQNRFQVSFPEESQDELKAITESSFHQVFSERNKESFDRTYVLSDPESRAAIERDAHEANYGSSDDHTYQLSEIPAFNDRDEFQAASDDEFAVSAGANAMASSSDADDASERSKTSDTVTSSTTSATNAASTDTDDDDSIEAYMNRLLQRVQGQSASTTSTNASKTPTSSTVVESVSSFPPAHVTKSFSSDSVTVAKPAEIIDPSAPLIPRSQAPEAAGNLAAMREIANSSANSAISVSVRSQAQQMKSRAIMDLLQAAVVMICAFAFFACGIKIPSMRYIWFVAATLATALAFFYVIDMVKKLATAKVTYENSNARGPEEESNV